MNERQRAVVGICENFTQRDRDILATFAVAYAEDEVRRLLDPARIDGSIHGEE